MGHIYWAMSGPCLSWFCWSHNNLGPWYCKFFTIIVISKNLLLKRSNNLMFFSFMRNLYYKIEWPFFFVRVVMRKLVWFFLHKDFNFSFANLNMITETSSLSPDQGFGSGTHPLDNFVTYELKNNCIILGRECSKSAWWIFSCHWYQMAWCQVRSCYWRRKV